MILTDLIRGKNKKIQDGATAIPAICATHSKKSTETLARIAPIAIASIVVSGEGEKVKYVESNDDRRHCAQCTNLTSSGLCLSARRSEIIASRDYHPIDSIPRRCEGYLPKSDDHDHRTGQERWPWLIRK